MMNANSYKLTTTVELHGFEEKVLAKIRNYLLRIKTNPISNVFIFMEATFLPCKSSTKCGSMRFYGI